MAEDDSTPPPGYGNSKIFLKHDTDKHPYLLDEIYSSIANTFDESAAVLKANLVLENFLVNFIENIRKEGTEAYVVIRRYFMPKLCTCVAIGLPVSLADCLSKMNNIRNKYAHNLNHKITDNDIEEVTKALSKITVNEINHCNYFKKEIIESYFNGVYGVKVMRDLRHTISPTQKRICTFAAVTFLICHMGTFWMFNELHKREQG